MTTSTSPDALAFKRRDELLELVRSRGYSRRAEPFRLSSGKLSHDYVDMRRAVAAGADLRLAAEAVLGLLESDGVDFDAIGGMTMGADPVAHAVALLSDKSWFSVRKAEKEHGTGRRIEGAPIDKKSSVVLFEDTISTGGSILDSLGVVRASGARIVVAVTLLDRGESAARAFARERVAYRALLTYKDLGIEPIGA